MTDEFYPREKARDEFLRLAPQFNIYPKGESRPVREKPFDTQVAAYERLEWILRDYPGLEDILEVREVEEGETP
jgi:hypothetical protein